MTKKKVALWMNRCAIMGICTKRQVNTLQRQDSEIKPNYSVVKKDEMFNNGDIIVGGANFGYDIKLFREAEKLANCLDSSYEIMFPDTGCPCLFKCANNEGDDIYVLLAPKVNDEPEDQEWSSNIASLKKRLEVKNETTRSVNKSRKHTKKR